MDTIGKPPSRPKKRARVESSDSEGAGEPALITKMPQEGHAADVPDVTSPVSVKVIDGMSNGTKEKRKRKKKKRKLPVVQDRSSTLSSASEAVGDGEPNTTPQRQRRAHSTPVAQSSSAGSATRQIPAPVMQVDTIESGSNRVATSDSPRDPALLFTPIQPTPNNTNNSPPHETSDLLKSQPPHNGTPPALESTGERGEIVVKPEAITDATLNSPPKLDKGKGRAHPMIPLTANGQEPDLHLAKSKAHEELLQSLYPSLTCRICLLLMDRPFTVVPCGHTSCYSCLVSWFKAGDPVEQSNRPNRSSSSLPPSSPNPSPAGPSSHAARFRRKTCPHCRTELTERPIEVWSLKDTISTLLKSGLVDEDLVPSSTNNEQTPGATAQTSKDPWNGIFHEPSLMASHIRQRELRGIQDIEDGGIFRCVDCANEIWAGECTGCHRVYPWRSGRDFIFDDEDDDDEDDLDIYLSHEIDHSSVAHSGSPRHPSHRQIIDINLDSSDEGSYEGSFIDDGSGNEDPNRIRVLGDSSDSGDSDIEFMDGPSTSRMQFRPSTSPIQFRPARSRRRPILTIGSSSDEALDHIDLDLEADGIEIDDDDEDDHGIRRQGTRRRMLLTASSDNENEEASAILELGEDDDLDNDSSLAERVAAREQELYGDDGSVPATRRSRRRFNYVSSDESIGYGHSDDDEELDGW